MNFQIEKINGDIIQTKNGTTTSFKANFDKGTIELNYKYKGEPNYGRIQLELEFLINGKNVIGKYNIENHIELPYQYPRTFELLDSTNNIVAIPHSYGIIIVNLDENSSHLVKYQTNEYQYSYFYKNELIIVESKCIKITSLTTLKEKIIDLQKEGRVFINGVQIKDNEIDIIVRNADINDSQLLTYSKKDLIELKKINLSELIADKELMKFLNKTKKSKLVAIPEFKYPSIISSWRFIPNIQKNSLIGRVEKWETPEKKDEYYERTEHFCTIKISLNQNVC
jgi:hypothetical protein